MTSRAGPPTLGYAACRRLVRAVRRIEDLQGQSGNVAVHVRWAEGPAEYDYVLTRFAGMRLNPGYPSLRRDGWKIDNQNVSIARGHVYTVDALLACVTSSSGEPVGNLTSTPPERGGPRLTTYAGAVLDHDLLKLMTLNFGVTHVRGSTGSTYVVLTSPYGTGYQTAVNSAWFR